MTWFTPGDKGDVPQIYVAGWEYWEFYVAVRDVGIETWETLFPGEIETVSETWEQNGFSIGAEPIETWET